MLNRLNAATVMRAKVGMHPDGGGLYLQVTEGADKHLRKSWFYRFTRNGRERRMGLGPLRYVGLARARQLADDARRLHEAGLDPLERRDAQRRDATDDEVVTFRKAFAQYFALKRPTLSNPKHAAQWQSTMTVYVFPHIGDRPVADVTPGEIIDCLKPIWHEKPETAHRVLQRVSAVFTSAITRELRTRANPCIGVGKELGARTDTVMHHRALGYRQVPAFVSRLRASNSWPSTRLGFEWLILSATRSGETRLATWGEIDEAKALWTIPAARLKTRRRRETPHRVPLPPRCLEILSALKVTFPSGPGDLLFPSMKGGKPLSDMVFVKLLRDMGLGQLATPHGMRSSFKVWCAEIAKVRDEISETALAHVDTNDTRDAYRRTDYLDERRKLMNDWANYITYAA